MNERLFVYGTLLPRLAPQAMRDVVERLGAMGPATVRGRLFHLGAYPGIVLDESAGRVSGQVLEIPDSAAPELWLRLDAYEGFLPDEPARSLFRRVRCRADLNTGGQIQCWVYVFNGDVAAATQIDDGVWKPPRPESSHREEPPRVKTRRRPLIGLTLDASDDKPGRYSLPQDYAASIERAGGLPLAIPFKTDLSFIPEIVEAFDGILFTGGDDLDPALYGETWHPSAEHLDPDRQRFELALLAEVERRRVPALGVCLGSQLMNVHRGGSLIQFLPEQERPDALEHRKLDDPSRRHPVFIDPDSVLGKAIGKSKVLANTRHKQAVKRLGQGLRVNATAPDGVVEGFEDPTMPLYLAVQWHPENLSEQPEHLAPFRLLVERAGDVGKSDGVME